VSIETTAQTYYVVKVFLNPAHGNREGKWEWLAVDSGYCSHSALEYGAFKFEEEPPITAIREYSGRPWYCRHDLEVPPRIFRVTETHTVQKDEVL